MSQSLTNYYPIVGAHFRPPAKVILQFLPMGCPLVLEREPSNEFDVNAIAVYVNPQDIPLEVREDLGLQSGGFGFTLDDIMGQGRWHLGYVPAKFATALAPTMDNANGSDPYTLPTAAATLTFDSKGKPAAMPVDPAYGRQQFFPGQA